MSISKKFFAQFDMFSAPPLLRAKKQPQTSSYLSGTLSFALALFFCYVFIINTYGVITYVKINSDQTQSKLSGSEVSAPDIYFAVRVGYLPYNTSKQVFDIGIYTTDENGNNLTINMIPCQAEAWKDVDGYQEQYKSYQMSQFLCPETRDNLDLEKVFYHPQSRYVMIYVRPCSNSTDCMNTTAQKQFVEDLKNVEGAIFVLLYFLDNTISPNDKVPVNPTINTDSQLSFTTKRGTIATIQLQSFQIQTDYGIFPVEEVQTVTGNMLHSFREVAIELDSTSQNYCLIYVSLNRKFIQISRKVGKIDEMLSYAGGLFSIIVGFLSVFIFSFNEYRYELMVAEGVFTEDDSGTSVNQNHLNLVKYIKYTIFDWVKVLFCYQIKWGDCKIIDQAREQAACQMDVTSLFRRINSFEVSLKYLMSEEQKQVLSLLKPQSLAQTKKNRLILEYYWKVMNDEISTTISEYRISQAILRLSLNIANQNGASSRSSRTHQGGNQNDFVLISALNKIPDDIEEILDMFPEIIQAAEKVVLDEQMIEAQIELVHAFFSLSKQKRKVLEENIPLKILARLVKRKPKPKQKKLSTDSDFYKDFS